MIKINSDILNINISVSKDNIIHSTIICGANRTFTEVLQGLKLCENEIKIQIKNRKKCPFYK